MKYLLLGLSLALSGCFSTGIIPTGADTYMVSRTSWGCGMGSASNVKAGLYEDAFEYCSEQGKMLQGVSEDEVTGVIGRCASAEIEFRCVDN